MESISECCTHREEVIHLQAKMEESETFFESRIKKLESVNLSLKNKLSISERNVTKLQEAVAELKLELNVLHFKDSNGISVCTQTEVSDDHEVNAILNEMCIRVPRIISPLLLSDTQGN